MSEEEEIDELDLDADFQLDSYDEEDDFDDELGLALMGKKGKKKDSKKQKGPGKDSASEDDNEKNVNNDGKPEVIPPLFLSLCLLFTL
jgi:hypothetical protein